MRSLTRSSVLIDPPVVLEEAQRKRPPLEAEATVQREPFGSSHANDLGRWGLPPDQKPGRWEMDSASAVYFTSSHS